MFDKVKRRLDQLAASSPMKVRLALVYLLSAAGLLIALGAYWFLSIEPRLRAEANTSAAALAQAHSRNIAEAVVRAEREGNPELLNIVLDEILLITAPNTEQPFIRGIELQLDTTLPGMETVRRGSCNHCFQQELPLYAPRSGELIGAAHFLASDAFYAQLKQDVRTRLIMGALITLLVIGLGWWSVLGLFARLRASEARAQAAAKAKGEFLATMSHEIRTPLNGILGMVHLLQRSAPGPQHADYIDTIASSSKTLLAVVDDILDFSQIEAGKLTLNSEPLQLQPQLEAVQRLFEPTAREKGIEVCLEIAADLPAWLMGDPVRLRQVLLNLMGNALKFTERGRITLSARRHEMAGLARVEIAVADTGVGIAADKQLQLFEPFSQAESGRRRRYGGTGLGLAICKRLVDAMAGEIGFHSQQGRGSTFYIRLPIRSAQPPVAELAKEVLPPEPNRSLRVLVVDDDPINRRVACGLLSQRGHVCTQAVNGREALARIGGEAFDLVLMDLHMPEMDGIEATQAIRALAVWERAHIPILALSADIMPEERQACLNAGMDGFIAKPFHPDKLEAEMLRLTAA